MHIVAPLVFVEGRELASPLNDVGWEFADSAGTERPQRRVASVVQPVVFSQRVVCRLDEEVLVVTFEADHRAWRRPLEGADSLDDACAIEPPVDVVAEEDKLVRATACMIVDSVQEGQQEVITAVNVTDGVGQAHGSSGRSLIQSNAQRQRIVAPPAESEGAVSPASPIDRGRK